MVLPAGAVPGVVEWVSLSTDCSLGTPRPAVGMLSNQQGTGAQEEPVSIQQVAIFPDVDTAVAEADRVSRVMARCASAPAYSSAPVPVGAQGIGLAYGYGGAGSSDSYPFGSHLVLTRRGNALSLTGSVGGEGSPARARKVATDLANQAWSALCGYDRTRGC